MGTAESPKPEVRLETLLRPQSCLYPLREHCAGGETEAGGCDILRGAATREPLDGEGMGNHHLLGEPWVGDAPAQSKLCPQRAGTGHRDVLALGAA